MSEESRDKSIGRLEGKMDLMLAEQQRAAGARKQTYEKMDELSRKLDGADRRIGTTEQRLDKIEVPVAEFSRWRERFIGMALLTTFIAGSVGAVAAWLWGKIIAAMTG
ncbi:hypothetical protein C5748_17170 [Phyllobacterium phragmitis]|uniref:DUF1515 domain-containing protein n=1 Tax=Phyllobacterium phragmitis TaxID=2670329 RepID=A0A2S9INW0_9HYPH|nr:hypothetical protein [Phyllobacterium phragmitis]PRD42195.1 hypothetical protein C5748_17170 [Phyllobacterium phragmitis]